MYFLTNSRQCPRLIAVPTEFLSFNKLNDYMYTGMHDYECSIRIHVLLIMNHLLSDSSIINECTYVYVHSVVCDTHFHDKTVLLNVCSGFFFKESSPVLHKHCTSINHFIIYKGGFHFYINIMFMLTKMSTLKNRQGKFFLYYQSECETFLYAN